MPQVGGIQVFNHQVLSRLPDAAVFAAAHPQAHEHDDTAPYRVIRGPHRYLFPVPAVERALRDAVAATRADVLLFATPWPVVSLGPRLGLPSAVVSHGNELVTPARLPLARQLLRRDLRRADLLYAVSDHTAGHLRDLVGTDGPPIRLLRNGVDVTHLRPVGVGAGDPGPARLRRRPGGGVRGPAGAAQGPGRARRGMAAGARPRAGRPPADRRGRATARRARRGRGGPAGPGAVVLAGRVPWDELAAHHAAADVFAHPNRTRLAGLDAEGFGVIFLEAQAVGRPVVAGDSGGSPEALRPGETGLLVDGADPAAVADAVVELLEDPDRARAMGRAGRAFVEAHHDWDAIVADLHATWRCWPPARCPRRSADLRPRDVPRRRVGGLLGEQLGAREGTRHRSPPRTRPRPGPAGRWWDGSTTAAVPRWAPPWA